MANVVRDPKVQPDAILPDLSKPDPLVTFMVEDIAFVYGSKWKQRYFERRNGDYYPLGAQWDVTNQKWRPYLVKEDWWVPFYPPANAGRPTSTTCDGCHSVNYDLATRTPTEWNVGCEKCHGPGSDHARLVNPAHLGTIDANDVCIQCHSQGRPLDGRPIDWPVGFEVGAHLKDYWKLEDHVPGTTTFTHYPDGTAHKNRMQGNDFVQSKMFARGLTCFTCHDPHGSENESMLRKPGSEICLDCHGPKSPNGPTHTLGNACVGCHMPKNAQTIADVNVRSHAFKTQ